MSTNLILTRPLVFFDLETTGTDISNDRIVEISLVKLFPDNREEVNTFRINPGIPIPPEATAIHGITNEDEILEEVKALQLEMDEKVKKMGEEN